MRAAVCAADAGGALRFDATRLTATAGTITIRFDNPARVPHAFSVAGESTEVVIDAAAPPIAVELDAGRYEFVCPVGSHAGAGMTGTLIVR